MSRNGRSRAAPSRITRMTAGFSTTNRRPLLSLALATSTGLLRPRTTTSAAIVTPARPVEGAAVDVVGGVAPPLAVGAPADAACSVALDETAGGLHAVTPMVAIRRTASTGRSDPADTTGC